ncbi:Pre-mRNA-splicing factor 38B [Tetrabaena socialis]|uniref:Pre-mRNA-splicing factor 38 n=1 Tax=Tetrabaena socialis TaxID=47790 RepID=A0A2J7ZZU5_9CHLO|nr:Pre-mRNA-splicing factor 38B [Tetrabaena socialis]|eukprot:PNH05807.1 Pre-mRNA-splicing factor 38B [Tetrabaena socialis]
MEQYGSTTTYNLENVLRQNILGSDYYRQTCMTLSNWSDIVDEIFEHVDHVEPWMSGNARGPSSAFCLLHRLFTLKLTAKEVKDMVDHRDSPYIRAVGFLYLRYVADPKTMWNWCGPYVKDQEMFAPSGPEQKEVTMGDYVRDLLLSQERRQVQPLPWIAGSDSAAARQQRPIGATAEGSYYFETIFPRIPKPVQDVINDDLKSRGLPTTAKGNAGAGGTDRRGMDDTGNRRPASVKASLSVAFGQRAPNRAGAREEGRGRDPSATQREAAAAGAGAAAAAPVAAKVRASASPEPPRDRREPLPPSRRDYGREGRDARGGGGDRHDRDYDRDRRDGRDRDGREKEADRERGRERGRPYDDRREGSRRASRSRSRSRDRRDGGAARDSRDVFKEAPRDRRGEEDLRSRYGNGSGSGRR